MPRAGAPERILGFLLLTFVLSGCGTFVSKITGPDNTQGYWLGLGHPYEGVIADIGTVKCSWEQQPPALIPMNVLVTIALIIDLPLSLVADTLVLPIDLFVKPQRSRADPEDCHAPLRRL